MNKDKVEGLVPHQIKKNRQFIKGDKQEKFGIKADYSQATFVMNDKKFDSDLDNLLKSEATANDIIYLFYGHLYPYIEAALNDNWKLYSKAEEISRDSQDTVNMYAKLKFDHDVMLEFIEEKGNGREFTELLRSKQKKLDKQVQDVIADQQLTLL